MLAVGEILSGYTGSFAALFGCRVIEGIGFGLMAAPLPALVMQWFPAREWPYINMANALCFYVGLAIVFSVTVPIFLAAGSSWHAVFTYYGVGVAVIALGWTIFGRSRETGAKAEPSLAREPSALLEVLRERNILIFAGAFFGQSWFVQLYTAFLPEYFRLYRGFSLGQASALTGLLPLTGIFAAMLCGVGTGLVGLRRPFLWPVASLALLGCVGAVMMPGVNAIRLSLVVMGIGVAGVFAPALTFLMELPGTTPRKVGAAQAFTFTCGYVGAFIAPFLVVGWPSFSGSGP